MIMAVFCGTVSAESSDKVDSFGEKMQIDSQFVLKNDNIMTKTGLNNAVPNGLGDRDILAPSSRGRGGWSAAENWNNKTILNNTIHDIATGDLNGDGFADLAVVGENHTIATYHNNQSYGFRRHFVDIDNNKNYTRVALGDVDNDGDLDIMVFTWPNPQQEPTAIDLYLYTNNGGGNFNANGGVHKVDVGGAQATFGFLLSMVLASGDFNNDGNADFILAISHEHPTDQTNPSRVSLFFLLNNGQGGYASTSTTTDATNTEYGLLYVSVLSKEATGDNFDDVVVNIYGYDEYSEVNPNWHPGEVRVYKGGAQGIILPNAHWSYKYNQNDEWTVSVDVGEFTGDANPDILISTDAMNGNGEWKDG
ncbi:MAG: VCBS repeat-containing protein, partial [Candidatus Thermoplasmatota archaeon]|nr:VCBS repeat-containing protein [Candidatus Thermoplasmatota archaeon]